MWRSELAFFGELVVRTDEARREFENNPAVLDAVAHGMSVDRYRRFLLELYHIVFHFNPICAAAASRVTDEEGALRDFLYRHMQEESGHEIWVLNDLESIGLTRASLKAELPSVFTSTLCGFNYWSADRRHPCAVLGMMYALEVIASVYGGAFSAALRESLLLTGDLGISFISSHATMDQEHMIELRHVLDTLTGKAAQDSVVESVLVNFHHFTRIFETV
jgi:pyrroloquinoline quinone (PQQ) biosynthesis protein C